MVVYDPGPLHLLLLERRFNPDQERGPDGKFAPGGGDDDEAAIVQSYGPIVDKWEPMAEEASLIAVHDNGQISVSFEDTSGDLEVWGDFDAEGAHVLAGRVAEAADSAQDYDPDAVDAIPVSSNGLVDWGFHTESEGDTAILVGHDDQGMVVIGWPKTDSPSAETSLDDWDIRFLDAESDARDFSDFLDRAADASDEMAGS